MSSYLLPKVGLTSLRRNTQKHKNKKKFKMVVRKIKEENTMKETNNWGLEQEGAVVKKGLSNDEGQIH